MTNKNTDNEQPRTIQGLPAEVFEEFNRRFWQLLSPSGLHATRLAFWRGDTPEMFKRMRKFRDELNELLALGGQEEVLVVHVDDGVVQGAHDGQGRPVTYCVVDKGMQKSYTAVEMRARVVRDAGTCRDQACIPAQG